MERSDHHTATTYKILIVGASYGSLLAAKLLAAGHTLRVVCLAAEAEPFNEDGARIRMPAKGREGLVEIHARKLLGRRSAGGAEVDDPSGYDLIVLAMQEPQYRSSGGSRTAR
jgi:ketopantoate reductase